MRNAVFLIILLISSYVAKAQGGRATFSFTNPPSLTVCGTSGNFSIQVNNISSSPLTNVKFVVTMPDGMNYDASTVTGATEFDISVPKAPVFSLADIPALSSVNLDFYAYADCGINTFLAVDSPTVNILKLTYDTDFDSLVTAPFAVLNPSLSIISISNQTFSGVVGNTFVRSIVIKNTGDGALSGFTFDDTHGNGISIVSMSPGSFSNIGLIGRDIIGAGEFMGIGNLDKFFDPGEQITITETIQIDECLNLTSDYDAYWGCNSQNCQVTTQTGNVTITPGVPNLVYTISNGINTCYDTGVSAQSIKIKNTGTEPARNILVDVFQCTSNLVWDPTIKMFMFIDPASVQYNYHGTISPATIDSSKRGNLTSALGTTNYLDVSTCIGVATSTALMGRFFVSYPILAPGDSVTLMFNLNTCCPTTCNFSGNTTGWRYRVDYQNQCVNNNYTSGVQTGRGYSSFYENTQMPINPSDLSNGQSGTFTLVNDALSTWTRHATARIQVEFTLPPELTFANNPGDIVWVSANGLTTVNPMGVAISGSTVTATFPYNGTTNQQNSETRVILTAACGTTGSYNIPVNTYMIHNNSCTSCRMLFRCSTWSVRIHCPAACPTGGFSPYGFNVQRITYGDPDNDNNGVADGAGSLDFTKIRTERATFGDTIEAVSFGKVFSGTGGVNFNRIFNKLTFTNASNASRSDLRVVSSTLTIYDKSSGLVYTCNNIANSVTNISTTRSFLFEANAATLIGSGCLPPGFVFEDQDSVVISCRFRMAYNVGGNVYLSQITDTCYAANVANPTPAQRFFCDVYNGQMSLIGYYYTTWGPDAINTSGCNQVTLNQSYYLSIGACCSNYAGGNMFPYEYRQFGHLDSIIVQIPAGYTYASAQLNQVRTAGSGITVTNPTIAITPVDVNANPLRFYVGDRYGASLSLGDDGWHGTYTIRLTPSCAVVPVTNSPVTYTTKFAIPASWATSSTSRTIVSNAGSGDFIYYQGPVIQLQSALPTVNAVTDSVYWDVLVSNITTIAASNTWFGFTNSSGKVNVYRVEDLGTMSIVNPTGSIYQVGTLGSGVTKTYRVYAKFTNCSKDSVIFNSGWNCTGYPTSVATYPCTPQRLALNLIPIKPVLSTSVVAPPNPSNLCDTLDYEFTVANTTAGFGLHPFFNVRRPVGMSIVPGSVQLEYPLGSGFTPIPNGISFGFNTMWSLDTVNAALALTGLQGPAQSPNHAYRIKFKVVTSCNYISGTYLRITNKVNGGCGTGYFYYYSAPIKTITGVPIPYTTTFVTTMDTIRDCTTPVNIKMKMINLGVGTTNATDKLFITLPQYINYQALSVVGIHNTPIITEPNITPIGLDNRLEWDLPAGVIQGDSVVFSFQVTGDVALAMGNQDIDFQSLISYSLSCGATTCNINSITGTATKQQYVDRQPGLWTGKVDTDWFNPLNWGDCKVPTCAVDVLIPNVINQPIISTSATAATRNIQVNSSATVTFNPNAVMHICGDMTIDGSYLHNTGSQTHFTGNAPQTYTQTGIVTLENIVMNQTATSYLNLNQNLNIANGLTLTNGVISTGVNEVFVSNGAPTSVNAGNVNSYIEGNLRRNTNANGLFYLPVGIVGTGYELAEIDLTNRNDLTQLFTNFRNWPGIPPTLNQTECSADFTFPALNHGYWVIDGTVGATNPVYNVYLNNLAYTNLVGNGWTIMKRPTGSASAWTVTDGTCSMFSTAPRTLRYNLSQFSEFAVAQTPDILPVQLLSFEAYPLENHANLRWTTTNEVDSRGFDIQRSENGMDFISLTFIPSQNAQINQYQHNDFSADVTKTYYYRLKQIDINGGYQYSEVKIVNWNAKERFEVYPNPTKSKVTLEWESLDESIAKIRLVNNLGQEVWNGSISLQMGINKHNLDLIGVSPGVYTLEVQKANHVVSQRLVITP